MSRVTPDSLSSFPSPPPKYLTEELHSQHSAEVISLQRAHQVAVGALRDQLQQQGREDLRLLAETHSKEMGKYEGVACVPTQINC